jgi:Ca-activated chloride channel family protein
MTAIYWREANWLWFAGLPALLWLLNLWWQQRKWASVADPQLLPWVRVSDLLIDNRLRLLSLFAGWVLLCIALAGPRTVENIPPEQQPDPATLIFIVDFSASMNAQDLQPDRRTAAQALMKRWMKQKTRAVAVATILFAGHAFELHPVTSDKKILQFFIAELNQLQLPTLGNNLPAAIKTATAAWPKNTSPKRLIIFTDGDMEQAMQQQSSQSLLELRARRELEITLIGSAENKAVTVPDGHGELITQNARPVLSRLQARWMKQLDQDNAKIHYLKFTDAHRLSLQQVLQLPALSLDKQAQKNVLWKQWFPPFLIGGIIFILLSLSPTSKPDVIAAMLITLTIACSLLPPPTLAAQKNNLAQAQQALADKNYKAAIKLFDSLSGYDAKFGLATGCFRIEDYSCAKAAFTTAILQAKTTEQKARAIFNLGNSYFFLGDYDQAEVLFRDAGLHGIDQKRVAINLAYAHDMKIALQRHIQDIRETLRRAQWRAAASGDIPPELDDLLANDRSMLMPRSLGNHPQAFYRAYQKVFQKQLSKLLGFEQNITASSARNWVKTEQKSAQSSAALFNRLFEMEVGILAPQQQPKAIRGQRQW